MAPVTVPDATTSDAQPTASLARLWRGYARNVYGDAYPLYRALASAVAEDGDILDFLLGCPPGAHDPNLLLAAMQYMALSGTDHPLADSYRAAAAGGGTGPGDVPWLLHDFWQRHRDRLSELVSTRHIQTNEIGRCGGLALALRAAAGRIGEPLALVDAGASAGLNLAMDEYLLDYGDVGRVGPGDSPLHIRVEMTGRRPSGPLFVPRVSHRVGIDRAPVDLDDGDTVRWLLACVWPGNERQDRLRAAVALRRGRPYPVRRGDMIDDLDEALSATGRGPVAVVTSWSYSYLAADRRHRFVDALVAAGRRRPVAWICCDLAGTVAMFEPGMTAPDRPGTPSVLGMAVMRGGGTEPFGLAYMHSHGAWVHWAGTDQYGSF